MRCEECREEVEAYFDRELDASRAERVSRHLSACAECGAVYGALGREQELYLGYECDARPGPAFWDGVMERAAPGEAARPASSSPSSLGQRLRAALGAIYAPRFSAPLTALMVIAAIGITAGVMRYISTGEVKPDRTASSQNTNAPANVSAPAAEPTATPILTVTTAPVPEGVDEGGNGSKAGTGGRPRPVRAAGRVRGDALTAANSPNAGRQFENQGLEGRGLTPDQLVREAEQKYRAAIVMLGREVNRRPRLDADTAERFERTLAAVDRTIADTRRAVRKHPGDPVAAQYMLTAYSKKVEVLREMVGY